MLNPHTTEKSPVTIVYIPASELRSAEYNPRKWDDDAAKQLSESIKRFGLVDPIIVNSAPNRKNIIVGGHFRYEVAKKLGIREIPTVYVNIPDLDREKELNLRLNKNVGEWDWNLLAEFDENLLADIGFSSEELDDIFGEDENPEIFDLAKELAKLKIDEIVIQKGDIWQLDTHKMMCGDSTIEPDILKLMGDEKADMCFTDEPYLLNYLLGKKKHGTATEGFGYKRDRRYLETDSLPPNFIDLWTANINKIQKENFSIIAFENWKNLTVLWNTMEKFWKIRNLLIWHLPNRTQGFAAKYKFFSKHDIAVIGTAGDIQTNMENEEELLQNEYEAALYATSGKPNWEGYEKGKKICPTDFVEFRASDEKNSGQGIIFGTKPVEILIPYIKFLTKRNDLIVEPFGGSGSTLIAAEKLKRRCNLMEKSPVYAEVIKNRWEKLTGKKAKKIS
ncbi:MAG: ParB domain protein nuclease [Candidatus Curtissbacteria bacterium GW2011_GWA1_41_11]|uniref:ParB domain protein nuclease n=1 Tax=Candidatus Curtissbacteria bacterium GW2011_GWA1_41_11 TaxID=1618409 RepID=A0A0G0XGX8_9BACT|nr:MAG: ParB domain protein nuclease [Candidatus Curtissbacteria bacterium GW2011_GWA1_41_11]